MLILADTRKTSLLLARPPGQEFISEALTESFDINQTGGQEN
jgi:hypothetical protein